MVMEMLMPLTSVLHPETRSKKGFLLPRSMCDTQGKAVTPIN